LGNTPGVVVMDPDGAYIYNLQDPPDAPKGTLYHAVVSNYHPPREWLARLGDMGVDTLFGGANDLVVPTEGGWKTSDNVESWIPGERVACSGPGGNFHTDLRVSLHHGAYFGDAEAVAAILSCMNADATGLPRIATERALPSRSVLANRRSAGGEVGARGANAPADGGQVAAAESVVAKAEVAVEGFDEEDVLSLTVISQILRSHVEDETDSAVPMLMAEYRGARVTEHFFIKGESDDAGKRWLSLIRDHKKIVGYANGEGFAGNQAGDLEGEINFPNEAFLKAFGMELFRTLFPGEVRNLYNIARFQHKKRRLKIVFTSMIPWVADMPWELAYDRSAGAFLACADVRFIRNVLTPTPVNPVANKSSALRILVVSAQPMGAGALSIEDERRGIHESFRPLIDAGLAEVEVLAGASPCALQERLRYRADGDEFDVLHFIGHGAFDPQTKVGTLLFEDELGRPKSVTATDFLNILRGRGIRLVFLNACETGRGATADYNRGVAMELVRDGIPAVVANQYSVIDRSASLFSLHFYACLASGLNIADAMREARIALLYDGVEPMDWSVPVLFANNPDARLCRPLPRPALAGAESSEAFRILSRTPGGVRRGVGRRRKLISVWDAENALIYRENLEATLAELNDAQAEFEFHLMLLDMYPASNPTI
ncbi:MAG: CHAT domain-containing protein, partial [Roseimicrobium sp.]